MRYIPPYNSPENFVQTCVLFQVRKVFSLVFVLLQMAYAQSEEVSYYNMSLSELLDVQITTVSKRLEPIENAPGIVTVVNRSEIEMYGGNDLHDLLRRVPGVIPHTSHLIPDNLISIRGQHSSVIDRRNLILINGRPLKESQTGGSGATFYNSFPLSAIERVELSLIHI